LRKINGRRGKTTSECDIVSRQSKGTALKTTIAALVMIVVVLIIGPHFHLNPILPIFVLLGVGIYGMYRDEPRALTWRKGNVWGHGLGVYFDRDDGLVQGRESNTVYDVNDGAPRGNADDEKTKR
jgi:hypothetical protein